MKPIKLTMTAFGPYKNTEVVDFTELDAHNLFVISGNTGAGKTTIFDGICFALYGSASGQDREEVRLLRSDFADDDVHTAVELEFVLKNRHYRIRRQLGHVKKGNKTRTGEQYEFFEKQGDEEIPCVDRQIVSEINQRVEELIGLSQDQFKQIVMLPQGEFRKLLTSETENKEAILRRLFKTENYKQINEVVNGKRSEANQSYENHKQSRQRHIDSISKQLPEREDSQITEVLQADFYNISQVLIGLEDEIEFYTNKIDMDEKEYKSAYDLHHLKQESYHQAQSVNARFNDFDEKLEILNDLKTKSDEYRAKEQKLVEAEKAQAVLMYEMNRDSAGDVVKRGTAELAEAEKVKQSAKQDLDEALEVYKSEENRQEDREQAARNLERLNEYLPLIKEIEDRKQKLNVLIEKGKKSRSVFEKLESQYHKLSEEHEKLVLAISELDKIVDQLSEKPTELFKLKEQAKTYKKYMSYIHELKELNNSLDVYRRVYEEKEKVYGEKEAAWLNNQAVVLANHLHDGKSCPVCGSLEHPAKATANDQAVTREELLVVKKEYEQKKEEYQKRRATFEEKSKQLQEIEADVKEYTSRLDEIDILYDELVVIGKKTSADVTKYNESREQIRELKLTEEQAAKEKVKLEAEYEKTKEIYQTLREDYRVEQELYNAEQKQIPEEWREPAALKQEIIAAEQKKTVLEKAWQVAQKTLHDKTDDNTKAETRFQHLTKQLGEAEENHKAAVQEFQTVLAKEQFVDEAAYMKAKLPEAEQKVLKDDIRAFNERLRLLIHQTEDLQKELQDKKRVDLGLLEEEVNKLRAAYEQALQQLNQSKEYFKRAVSLKEEIHAADEKVKESEQLLSVIVDVHDMLRGQNEKKISFERFLQIEYLEQIIHAANERLQRLSNNQYHLARSDRQEAHGRQSGLALDVYDSHTGQTRDVKSLSGGEKFHAALSLALGMSDVIQSFQGGISIDTMFIDEGFGSLDEEALTKAVDALIELMETGRMIGVISHVKELKEIFPAILEVQKTKAGHSKTEFILK